MEQIATNGKEVVGFKTKDSAIVATPLTPLKRLVHKYNMKKTGLNGYVYEFWPLILS